MLDPPPYPESGDDGGLGSDRGSTGVPRWVKVFVIIVIVIILAFVVSLLAGVRHGPGLHTPPGGLGGHTPPIEQEGGTAIDHGV